MELLIETGFDPSFLNERLVVELNNVLEEDDSPRAIRLVLKAHERAEHAKAQAQTAHEAAQNLQGLIDGLVAAPSYLCRFERLSTSPSLPGPAGTRVVCSLQGQTLELPIHPDVRAEDIAKLRTWHYVRVHAKERIVIGFCDDPELFDLAHGEVAELKGYHDAARRLVRVARRGHEEEIVSLSPDLLDEPLPVPGKVVLQRGDERWAIASLRSEDSRSRFEIPIDSIETKLSELFGLDSVAQPLIESIIMTMVYPEIGKRFDLRPLQGALLYSYKPGMGKTALMRAIAAWLAELGERLDFDVAVYHVKPNSLKSMWHGEDARIVREELCGHIRARQQAPRQRALFTLIVLDEIDSLGKRVGGDDGSQLLSSGQNDVVQALLVELDGLIEDSAGSSGPPCHVLWVGMTNRPDMLDQALKRPGRFGDRVLEMPELDRDAAEGIMSIYARSPELRFAVDGEAKALDDEEIRARFLRPAIAPIFDKTVLRYSRDGQSPVEVKAGQLMASVHYMAALNEAKLSAARRALYREGIDAIAPEDVADALIKQACAAAQQMEADRGMLARQLRIPPPISRVDLVPEEELDAHRFLRPEAT